MFRSKSFSTQSFSARSWRFDEAALFDLPPVFRRAGPIRRTPARRRQVLADGAGSWSFATSAAASLRLSGIGHAAPCQAVSASAGLSLGGVADGALAVSHDSTVDVVDVVLEAVMMTA